MCQAVEAKHYIPLTSGQVILHDAKHLGRKNAGFKPCSISLNSSFEEAPR